MSVTTIRLDLIDVDPDQPRRNFDPVRLSELAASIDANGLASPIMVRPNGERFVIVHGERRYRAVQSLGRTEIPAVVVDVPAGDVRWIQVAENLNRDDLTPIEEARAYAGLIAGGRTQSEVAKRLGKTRTYVTQKLRLLSMPAPLVLLVDRGALSEGHARQLLRIKSSYTAAHTLGRADDGIDYARWARPWTEPGGEQLSDEARENLTFVLITRCRPVDWPPAYPFRPKTAVVADAAEAMCREIAEQRHDYPRWVLPALYYAILAVEANASVAVLTKLVDGWIELIHAAILHTRYNRRPDDEKLRVSRDTSSRVYWQAKLWWAHRSDLRHAGLLDNEHIDDESVLDVMHYHVDGSCSVALPSAYGMASSPEAQEYAAAAQSWTQL